MPRKSARNGNTRRELEPKSVPQVFLRLLLGTRLSAIGQLFSLQQYQKSLRKDRGKDVRVHIMWGEKIKELGFVACYIQFFLEFQQLWKVTLKLPKQTEVNLLSVPYRGFLLSFNYAEQLLLTGFYILDSIHLSERMFSSNKISENRKKSKPIPGADLGGGCRGCAPPPLPLRWPAVF